MDTNRRRCALLSLLVAVTLLFCGCGSELISEVLSKREVRQELELVECISADRYVHNTLSGEMQMVYDEMLNAILNFRDNVRLSTTNTSDVKTCYNAICADYGEIFWVESCSYGELSIKGRPYAVSFVVNYAYTPQEVAAYKQQMQPVIDQYLERLAECESDYEKTEVLYRKLIKEVGYDLSAENNQNILSVFLGKETVCQGYACATQYLLQASGIPCAIITGTAQGQPHAWNLACLDGDYYYIDVTWGNTDSMGDVAGGPAQVNYGYLNITSEELLKNHTIQVDFPVKMCESTENNYYRKKKLFFDAWDVDAIGAKLKKAYDKEKDCVSVKFADRELFDQAWDYFIDEQHITDYCEGISQIYYVPDKDLNILTIYF